MLHFLVRLGCLKTEQGQMLTRVFIGRSCDTVPAKTCEQSLLFFGSARLPYSAGRRRSAESAFLAGCHIRHWRHQCRCEYMWLIHCRNSTRLLTPSTELGIYGMFNYRRESGPLPPRPIWYCRRRASARASSSESLLCSHTFW